MNTVTIRQLRHDFLFAFNSKSVCVVCHFQDIVKYWSKLTKKTAYKVAELPDDDSAILTQYIQYMIITDGHITTAVTVALRLTLFLFLTLTSTLPGHSASEVTTIRCYTNMCIIITSLCLPLYVRLQHIQLPHQCCPTVSQFEYVQSGKN